MSEPVFPPLFTGESVPKGQDPFDVACARAIEGCDAGLVLYDLASDRLRAAIVFVPEMPLQDAAVALAVCGVGFQNALGALAPPELPVHLEWPGGIRVNGGQCGDLRIAASSTGPGDEPDWIIVGLNVPLWPETEDSGHTPDLTALYAEGCADVEPVTLLEAWVRHTLVGLDRWQNDGVAPLHREFEGLLHGKDETVTVAGHTGVITGLDERLGLLLQTGDGITLIPLTEIIETTS